MVSFQSLLYVFLGGGLGSIVRYWISTQLNSLEKTEFAKGTFIINLLSCLIAGFIAGLIAKNVADDRVKLLLLTGFCGGFSTFSTYILESYHLLSSGQWYTFVVYVIGSIFLGLVLCTLGIYLAHHTF
jgi:fluoride exporter